MLSTNFTVDLQNSSFSQAFETNISTSYENCPVSTVNSQTQPLSEIIAENNQRATSLFYGVGIGIGRLMSTREDLARSDHDSSVAYLSEFESESDLEFYEDLSLKLGIDDLSLEENSDEVSVYNIVSPPSIRIKNRIIKIDKIYESIRSGVLNLRDFSSQLQETPDINASYDAHGNTLLHAAVKSDRVDIAKVLVEQGVRVDSANKWGQTALYNAVMSSAIMPQSLDMIGFLLAKGANPFALTKTGTMPLTVSFFKKKAVFDIFQNYVRFIPSHALEDIFNQIQLAIDTYESSNISFQEGIVLFWQKLIQSGFSAVPKCNGNTALHYAIKFDLIDFARELINHNDVVINEKNNDGYTALDYAFIHQKYEIIKLLKLAGATSERPTVLMVTDCSFGAPMYSRAASILRKEFIEYTICADDLFSLSSTTLNTIQAFLSTLPAEVNRVQALLGSGIKEIELLKKIVKKVIDNTDGIWLSGGIDICPYFYLTQDSKRYNCDMSRDLLELVILELQKGETYKPLLGVCRGNQMINVYYGGTLQNRGQLKTNDFTIVKRQGFLGSALSHSDKMAGYSAHFQSIDNLGENLEVVAVSDGMVKAIQSRSLSNPLMGTQFHPEHKEPSSLDLISPSANVPVLHRFSQAVSAAKEETCLNVETSEQNEKSISGSSIYIART